MARGRVASCLVSLALLLAASAAPAGELRGDANCDGRVDSADIEAVLGDLFGTREPCAGVDVNDDGRVSAADVIALMQILSASPTATPVTATAVVSATATATGTEVPPTVTNTPAPPTATATVTRTEATPTGTLP